jgi:hypothetical protein
MQSLLDYYSSLSPEQLEEEAKKLDGIPMPERIMASYVLFAKWAETDPQSAMAFSDKMGFTGMFVKPTIMQSWASVDPVAASKFYSDNPSQFAMMGVCLVAHTMLAIRWCWLDGMMVIVFIQAVR